MSWFGKEHGPYQLSQNDFLDATLRETITSADVIFVNNFAFGTKLNQQLKEIFSDCKEGCRIVSSLNFSPLDFSITTRTLYVSRAASLCLGIWGLFFHSSALCVTPPILFCLPQLFSFIHSLIHSFVFLFVCLSSHPLFPFPFIFVLCGGRRSDLGSILKVEKVTCSGEGVSWTSGPFDYYIQTVDRR